MVGSQLRYCKCSCDYTSPFTSLRQTVEWIIFVGLTTFIGTALWLFALVCLFSQEVTMFPVLDQTPDQISDQMSDLIIESDVRSIIKSNIRCYLIWYDLRLDVISDLTISNVSDLIGSDIG